MADATHATDAADLTDVGSHYRRTRFRLAELLAGIGPEAWSTPVAACPGWTVQGVLGHLVGAVEDVLDGTLTGLPDDGQTAAQVERHAHDRPGDLLARWSEIVGPFEQLVTDLEIWPAAIDVASHEHDIRAALGVPGARDDEVVATVARMLIEGLGVEGTVTVDLGDDVVRSRPGAGPDYRLRTSAFEVFRFRMGRRSRAQVAGLDWSRDPEDVLDSLFIFGPARSPLVE